MAKKINLKIPDSINDIKIGMDVMFTPDNWDSEYKGIIRDIYTYFLCVYGRKYGHCMVGIKDVKIILK